MSTVRLNGAYFSRAMRSQVSSTASKVSREWSAKRVAPVQLLRVQPVVQQEFEGGTQAHVDSQILAKTTRTRRSRKLREGAKRCQNQTLNRFASFAIP